MNGILEKFSQDAVQNPDRLLYNFLDCEKQPFGQAPITTGQAFRKAMDIAAALRAKGAKKGDRAIILSMQDAGTVYAVWGCMFAGVVFTVIPPPIDAGKLSRFVSVLKSCNPRFLISNESMEKSAETNVTGQLLRQAFTHVVKLKRIYTLMLYEQGVALSRDAVTVFSLASGDGEKPVLCAECTDDTDYRAIAREINRLTSQHFGFSFYDVVFVPQGALPRTDNRKVKTLVARDLYENGRLPVVYSTARRNTGAVAPDALDTMILSPDSSLDEICSVVIDIFKSVLPGKEVGPDDSFLELGGDSLAMVGLICTIEQKTGLAIDLRRIAAEPTARGISVYLSGLLRGTDTQATVDLRKECVLDEDIRPQNDYDIEPEACRNIFLTGATGFLGAYLIRSLIRRYGAQGVRIYCHTRAKTIEEAKERLISNMKRFACWDNESYRFSIVPVLGDLALPRMGLAADVWDSLSGQIDLVIHNGAILNFVLPYAKLRQTNVQGTAECLSFACTGRAKYHITQKAVCGSPASGLFAWIARKEAKIFQQIFWQKFVQHYKIRRRFVNGR